MLPFEVYNNPTKGFFPLLYGLELCIWFAPGGLGGALGAYGRLPWFSTYGDPSGAPKTLKINLEH